MRRLSETISAHRWWQVRVRRKFNVLDDGLRVCAFEMEFVVQEEPETSRLVSSVTASRNSHHTRKLSREGLAKVNNDR